jgi:ubiquitin-protein ligase
MANPFQTSPRARRLLRDFQEMNALRAQSSILDFSTKGDPPEHYTLTFLGRGIGPDKSPVETHQVEISLGSEYPRSMPSIRWLTPILHPNISKESVCMGSFTMSPYVRLVEIVEILWDMARMAVYNIHSGYHRDLGWQGIMQSVGGFPVDPRILRDRLPPAPPMPQGPGRDPDIFIMSGAQPPGREGEPFDQDALKANVEFYLSKKKLNHDARVYKQAEWQARKEKYGNEAVLTITTEGPLYSLLNDGSWPEAAEEITDLNSFLESMGVYWELGYAWSVHLYPIRRIAWPR